MTAVIADEQPLETPSGQWSALTMLEQLRLLIVAGIPVGVVCVGVGSRLAMLLLRVTSPGSVHGAISDDGFVIGRVTLAGTYNLLLIGAAVGIVGAGVHLLVSPWLLGPMWFRRLVVGAAAGSVGGSMLIHADGVDFTILGPTWLAIALFVALPAVFAVAVSMGVEAARDRWARQGAGRRRWVLPTVLVACFPPLVLVVGVAALVLAVGAVLHAIDPARRVRGAWAYGAVVRLVWMAVAVAGLVSLVRDIDALA